MNIASMEGSGADAYNQSDATGFIRLNALRLKARAISDSLLWGTAQSTRTCALVLPSDPPKMNNLFCGKEVREGRGRFAGIGEVKKSAPLRWKE